VRILALDYGATRTGVAISDETSTIASPLAVIERAGSRAGLAALGALILEQGVRLIVVGLPVSLDAREHGQARAVRSFVRRLTDVTEVPIVFYDERFTSKMARVRGGSQPLDARAAATFLEEYLRAHER
jgi:putative Holliday junction resolvase